MHVFQQDFYSILDIFKMSIIRGAARLTGFDKPTIWTTMAQLAIETKATNLGQGFPSWSPPKFYLDYLQQSLNDSGHQYTRAFGSLNYVEAIANYHKKRFPNLNPQTEICTVNGGVEGLYCAIMGLVDEGDQVIFFDPSYDCYRAQVQMAGGKSIGIPLKPKFQNSKQSVKERCKNGYLAGPEDEWQIDYEAFEKTITPKTKMFIFNTPHNPIGKVFSNEELAKLAKILQKYPRIVVVEDNVYEGMTFDDMYNVDLPKMCFQEGMYDRSLSIYSAGKIFAATGVRSGWIIGNPELIKPVRSIHQYSVFCSYNIIENTVRKSIMKISEPGNTYMNDYAKKLEKNRNLLLDEMIASKYDIDLWIPRGGYFVLADISRLPVNPKYAKDNEGNVRPKDTSFCMELAYEEGIIAVPCSPFYEKADLVDKYVRFAFCKDESQIIEAGKKMRKN